MHLIDTHAHIYLKDFDEDILAVCDRAKEQGVQSIYLPNIDSTTISRMMDLCKAAPDFCFPMMGLHPGSVNENWEKELAIIQEKLMKNSSSYKAVGEIGLDLYWDKTFIDAQTKVFEKQIEWAKELNLPIVVHVRDAFDEAFEVVDRLNDDKLRGIFHCFTGSLDQANHIIGYGGFKLGIGGVLTFKNSGLDAVIREIDLEHLVLETDSPYLAPTPNRGKRNEPSFISKVAEKLVDIKSLSMDEIAAQTSLNALSIFEG